MEDQDYSYTLHDPERCYFSPVMTTESGAKLAGYRLAYRVVKALRSGEREAEAKGPDEMKGPVFTMRTAHLIQD